MRGCMRKVPERGGRIVRGPLRQSLLQGVVAVRWQVRNAAHFVARPQDQSSSWIVAVCLAFAPMRAWLAPEIDRTIVSSGSGAASCNDCRLIVL